MVGLAVVPVSAGVQRLTLATRAVLAHLATVTETYGYEIGKATGMASGQIVPILARLERGGMVSSRWEDVEKRTAGRPPRKYVALTPEGRAWIERRLPAIAARVREDA